MSYLITVIVFILVFSVLILVHEFGHFIMAKRAGIKVEEFGFGLPPRIWGKKKGETIYSINWIPFGGFVRMLGEDSLSSGMLKNKRSFISKSIRARVKVVVAGVLMNFLLAWFLLTVGFTVGMQPLISPDDVLSSIDSGMIELVPGLKVKNIVEGSIAQEVGIKAQDMVYSFNGEVVDNYLIDKISENPLGVYKIVRDGKIYTFEVLSDQFTEEELAKGFGLELYDFAAFPRVKIFELNEENASYKAGLRKGDVILSVNGHGVYSVKEFEDIIRGESVLDYEIYRNGNSEEVLEEVDSRRQIVISGVLPDLPASKVGFKEGDIVLSVNGVEFKDSLELIAYVDKHSEENLAYLINRNGEGTYFQVTPEDGKIGVFLSELINYDMDYGMSLYNTDLISSVVKINDEKYPVYYSVVKSFEECLRMSKMTAVMFTDFVVGLFRNGEVPATVAGPVGIAQMTHVFVQEGFIPVLRFVAILSLSLAVINILPFPALDGGRLLFIIVEAVMGKRVNQKIESYIHMFGYLLIILLILAVTYSDIAKLL